MTLWLQSKWLVGTGVKICRCQGMQADTTYAVAVEEVVVGCACDLEMWEAELQQHLDEESHAL